MYKYMLQPHFIYKYQTTKHSLRSLTIESESGILDRDNFYKEFVLIKYLPSSFEFGIIY